jgi:hypothetical protein
MFQLEGMHLGRIQHGVSMGKEVWDFVYKNYRRLEYNTHSLMIEACVLYAIRNKFHEEISKEQLEHLKAYEKVGKHAEAIRPLSFVGNASKTLLRLRKQLGNNVNLGLMEREDADKIYKKARRELRESIKTTVKDQEFRELEERTKRKKAFLKKHGYKVTKNGKLKK